jgi:hypothetical protein
MSSKLFINKYISERRFHENKIIMARKLCFFHIKRKKPNNFPMGHVLFSFIKEIFSLKRKLFLIMPGPLKEIWPGIKNELSVSKGNVHQKGNS